MKKNTKILSAKEILKTVVVSVIISFTFLLFFRLTVVNGQSMEGTLFHDDKLLLSMTSYTFDKPEAGDIIVVKPEKINIEYIIKRVVAVPGDTVEIRDNVIYVNDVALEEDYIKEAMITGDIQRFTLGENEYFICGDNRNNSVDSRSAILGPITESEIFGKVVFNLSRFKIY